MKSLIYPWKNCRYLVYLWCLARLGIVCTISKTWKHPWRSVGFSKFAGLSIGFLKILWTFLGLSFPTSIYLFKVNKRNARTMWRICSTLALNTLNGVAPVSLWWTLKIFQIFWCFPCPLCEKVNVLFKQNFQCM